MQTAFTWDHVAVWEDELADRPPAATELEWPTFPQPAAIRVQPLGVGAVLQLLNRDGSIVRLVLNPIVARELGHQLMEYGRQAGWLDERYEVTLPPAKLDG